MKNHCCCPPVNPAACGCCEGIEALTPQAIANRPGLPALCYRIGTHASFMSSMLARLSSSDKRFSKLAELKTREANDASIALLDAWATVADVLTFYQERIANEGYLRTATERRSLFELSRLVGYRPKPGVAASVYLAYTLDDNSKGEVVIPKGSRAQSIPGPGELPQTFETSEDLKARAQWNNLRPRMSQPQTEASIRQGDHKNQCLYLKGTSSNLKVNDPLLIDFSGNGQPEVYCIKAVTPNLVENHTLVILQTTSVDDTTPVDDTSLANPVELMKELTRPPSRRPSRRGNQGLPNSYTTMQWAKTLAAQSGSPQSESLSSMRGSSYEVLRKGLAPTLKDTLSIAFANARVTPDSNIKVYALRVKASLFGSNTPRKILELEKETGQILRTGEWPIIEEGKTIYLDGNYEKILPYSWVVIEDSSAVLVTKSTSVRAGISRAEYGMSGKTTRLELEEDWININAASDEDFQVIRNTLVYAQSEELELAEKPIATPICGSEAEIIELDGWYEGLEAGRWVIVTGERQIKGTSAVKSSELAMIFTITQGIASNNQDAATSLQLGERNHTFIKLANKLEYCFKRDTVRIYGNVVKATHGETRKEVLGSGDGAKASQGFILKQPPLTYVSASNPSGVDSTLNVYVNDILWHETDTVIDLAPTDRRFITKTDDDNRTSLIFGNGQEGARLPTGIENIKATYRSGIGKSGNVDAEQISLLATRPLGVREVINPLPASGGADRENGDQIRKHTPLAIKALDRLVSVQDYADFAGVFAGIGKASAVEISDGRRQLVHVTIAGADDITLDKTSELYLNLCAALKQAGDPYQPIRVEIRELMLIVISANVRILPDYQWEPVITRMRDALLDTFSFERRELGQDVMLSEAISVMQRVQGVEYVDVDIFGGLPEKHEQNGQREWLSPEEIANHVQAMQRVNRIRVNQTRSGNIVPAQLAILSPDVPETLILNPII